MSIKKFTIIEIVVVIAILGILATIVVPNISNFKDEAEGVSIVSDTKNIQTAVEIYRTLHRNKYPSQLEPNEGNPVAVDFNKVVPNTLKKAPDRGRFWVDVFGQVWGATVDSPIDLTKNGSNLEWTNVDNAKGYILYEIINPTVSSINKTNLKKISDNATSPFDITGQYSKRYAISAVDRFGNLTAPVGEKAIYNYSGIPELNKSKGKGNYEVPTDTSPAKPNILPINTDTVIGSTYAIPDSGWARYENTNANIKYIGVWDNKKYSISGVSNGSIAYDFRNVADDEILAIKFTGSNFRLIGRLTYSYIDELQIYVDGRFHSTFTQYQSSGITHQVLNAEVIGLENTEHTIIIKTGMNSTGYVALDAIEIDGAGELLNAN